MKLLKFLLWTVAIAIIPLCAIAMADDCFDTVVDNKNGKVFYIDPFDKYGMFEDKKSLQSIYWDKIKCTGEKKVYSRDEYFNEIYKDLNNKNQKQGKSSDSGGDLIELIMSILWCVALWKIFVKAGKPGYYSLIPVYNLYEMSDIAGLSWLFKKAFWLGILWFLMIFLSLFIFPIALFPQIWIILILIFWIFMCIVNYNIAKNFWWSTLASILYVLFNAIAVLILAFWNDKYYLADQKEKKKELSMKAQMDEALDDTYMGDYDITTEWVNENLNSNGQENNSQPEEDPIKYIDPSQFT